MTSKELSKTYDPQKVEDEIYKKWEESGYFNPNNLDGEPYSIMMPPPNVTGVLHLGHAMENALMDIMTRYQRMQGKKTLLLPGTDHAAVATQAKVEKILIEKGIENPREDLGREELLKEIREYAENSKSTIISQIKKMGTSCDWSRLAYTFDKERNKAVNEVFKKMYDDGLIYRGHRVINWSVKGQSTCSDDELEHKERPGKLYTFKYTKDFPITIATTRPETKLGDTAVAVNPKDKRYKKYIGKTFTIDIGAAKPLEIKIIANDEVDSEFGTGAVGVTPAHSGVDFEMYEAQKSKNNPIKLIQVIGIDGKMTKESGNDYAGLSVEEARKKFVSYLTKNNLLEKEEEIIQNVGTSDRFGDVVEALPMTQWFVDVNKKIPGKEKSLKNLMTESVLNGHNGNKSQKINITPARFEKAYFQWIDNLRDWCISRQVWWGHQIPMWHCRNLKCGNTFFNDKKTSKCPKCKGKVEQDPDTLDTWFSSGLWTFSTLGWPEKTKDLETFHPTNWMQMGHEILFFWMARMILMSTYVRNEIPFKDVYMHGVLRDEKGNKFSKSAGNSIDPLEIIEKYGTDALRLSLITGITPGNDSKFHEDKVESARNFNNKLWNISRFIMQKTYKADLEEKIEKESLNLADKWITQKMADLIEKTTEDIEEYRFSQASEKLYNFTWHDFADWYIEVSKFEDNEKEKNIILRQILEDLLKLWHPFIPFVTENIWSHLKKNNFLMIESCPKKETYWDNFGATSGADEINFDAIVEIITNIRAIRAENKIETSKKMSVILDINKSAGIQIDDIESFISSQENIIKNLRTNISEIRFVKKNEKIKNTISKTTSNGITIFVPLEGLIDIDKEKTSKEKEIKNLENYIVGLKKKLSSGGFVEKAPENVIDQEKEKLEKSQTKLKELQKYLKQL